MDDIGMDEKYCDVDTESVSVSGDPLSTHLVRRIEAELESLIR